MWHEDCYFQACLPKKFWNVVVLHATFLINLVPSAALNDKTPYEVLHGKVLDLSQLRVFGSLCYASTLSSHRSRFDPRAHKGIFLGYRPGMKGYVIYDIHSHNVLVLKCELPRTDFSIQV